MAPTPVLEAALARAQQLGFIGPGPLGPHLVHAEGFAEVVDGLAPGLLIDLGAGGGLPGLVVAARQADRPVVLLDAQQRRCDHLGTAIEELGWRDRVTVCCVRAEAAGRDPAWRSRAAVVTARGFGPPAVTAECAAPLLRVGGVLVVSEPPEERPGRWDEEGLSQLGLQLAGQLVRRGVHFQLMAQERACPERFPRRTGVPAKRPLF